MNIKKFSLLVVGALFVFTACKKDDGVDVPVIEIRDRAEQQVEDMKSINEYLNNHYYNSAELAEIGLDAGIEDIVIIKVAENEAVPEGYTKMLDAVGESKKLVFEEVNYEYFVLEINQGGGDKSPTFADTVQILYEGSLLEGSVFDSKYVPDNNPLDLASVIPGWRKVIPDFSIAESFVENNDGTIDYYNSGLGVMILPSGLAYFSGSNTGIPSYSPLVFKFELLNMTQNDHDGDGIPSHIEDIDGDGELLTADSTAADDDTDGDFTPDYLDTDDDGDGIPTRDELESITYTIDTTKGEEEPNLEGSMVEFVQSRTETNGVITIKTKKLIDANNSGTWDYLDDTATKRYSND